MKNLSLERKKKENIHPSCHSEYQIKTWMQAKKRKKTKQKFRLTFQPSFFCIQSRIDSSEHGYFFKKMNLPILFEVLMKISRRKYTYFRRVFILYVARSNRELHVDSSVLCLSTQRI